MWSRSVEISPEEKTHLENTTSTDPEAQQSYFRYSPSVNCRGIASGEDWCSLASTISCSSSYFSPVSSKVDDIADPIDYPDGGVQAWIQVFVANLITMIAWGYPASFGVYQLHYIDTLKLSSDIVPWIGSVQTFLAFFFCTFSGRMADKGNVRTPMTLGCMMVVAGTLATSFICGIDIDNLDKALAILMSQGVSTGMGLGLCFMPPLSVANSYFSEKRRPFALAVVATGTGFGSILFTALVQYLIPVIGFEWTVRCQAFVVLGMSVVAVALIRPRLKPTSIDKSVDWEMFKDRPYLLFVCGASLFFFAIFFGFFYVSVFPLSCQPH